MHKGLERCHTHVNSCALTAMILSLFITCHCLLKEKENKVTCNQIIQCNVKPTKTATHVAITMMSLYIKRRWLLVVMYNGGVFPTPRRGGLEKHPRYTGRRFVGGCR